MIKYTVKLLKEEVDELMQIINKGSHTSHTFRSAYVLLNCDTGDYSDKISNEQICKILKMGMRTIDRIKKRFIEEGLDGALERKPVSRVYEKKIDGEVEAQLVKLCCSKPPDGFAKWSLRLLADKMVELHYVESISHVAIGSTLKKMNLNLGK
jgi:transposase